MPVTTLLNLGIISQKPAIVYTEFDYMEYSSDANAQSAYVTNDTTAFASQYPTQDADHVKATTDLGVTYYPYLATDPTKTVTGDWADNVWLSSSYATQRFHIDLGSAKVIKRIYYENAVYTGGLFTDQGVKNFTFWGSNTAGAFAELTYTTDTNWTQLTCSQNTFDQHVALDQTDPKYITVTNTTAYQYYAIKVADSYKGSGYIGFRRVELQTFIPTLQSYSEAAIKTQGSYALKAVAAATDSLNKTLTKTFASPIDLTGVNTLKLDMRASRTGANVKFGIHDTGGTTSTITPTIAIADTFQTVTWDISGVADADKNAIDTFVITPVNATTANTLYIDNVRYG